MREMQGTRGMFTRIPDNVFIFVFPGMFEKIPGNVQEDFGECFQFYVNESYVLLKKSKC